MKLRDKIIWRWLLLPAIIVSLILVLTNQAKARPQEAITLLYFQGTGQNNAILLEWATATEFNTAGFVIDRADSEDGPYTQQIGFIPGEGDGIIGAEYEALDDVNVVNGQTYWYMLIEIETDGDQNPTDPIQVTAGIPIPTPTPSRTPTTQPTTNSQPSATSTSTPSRTPTPTQTTQATAQPTTTSAPTNTPIPTQAPTQSNSPSQPTAAPASTNTPSNTNTGNVAQASAPNSPYPPPESSPSLTTVPDPNQANGGETQSYPPPAQATEEVKTEPYPVTTEDNANGEPAITPQIQPQSTGGARALTTQTPLDQQTPEDSEDSVRESSNTLFLWIGFTAAFLIFGGGVVGSILLFTRRSNQK